MSTRTFSCHDPWWRLGPTTLTEWRIMKEASLPVDYLKDRHQPASREARDLPQIQHLYTEQGSAKIEPVKFSLPTSNAVKIPANISFLQDQMRRQASHSNGSSMHLSVGIEFHRARDWVHKFHHGTVHESCSAALQYSFHVHKNSPKGIQHNPIKISIDAARV
jgi:hypothetical protein